MRLRVHAAAVALALVAPVVAEADPLAVASPSGAIVVTFSLEDGVPRYAVAYGAQDVLLSSRLGFRLRDAASLENGFTIVEEKRRSIDETWEQPWGEARLVRNHCNELRVGLADVTGRRMDVIFRAFDDGVGFRFEWPQQEGLGAFDIMDELTEFALPADHAAWWIPAPHVDRYEYLYRRSPVSSLGKVHTPLTLETKGGLYLSLHEAALTDYASMTLQANGTTTLTCDLVPWADGVKVKAHTPFVSPWRTLQIAPPPSARPG